MSTLFTFGKKKTRTHKHFTEELSTAVFTTSFVVSQNKVITYVSHDADDGAWQFFSDDEFDSVEEVAMMISLGEIIERDPTILELADMPKGHIATRKSARDKWIVKKENSQVF